jgi:hypothetical protein
MHLRESEDDHVQRLLNESKKRSIEEEFGGVFGEPTGEVPPEIEARWLDGIVEFERAMENADEVTVRQFLGNPALKPVDTVTDAEIRGVLDNALDLLFDNNIEIYFDKPLSDREMYRFIVDELVDEMIEDVRVCDMVTTYIYSEIHPDPERDTMEIAELFMRTVFAQRVLDDYYIWNIDDSEGTNKIRKQIGDFTEGIASFMRYEVNPVSSQVQDDFATTMVRWSFEALEHQSLRSRTGSGEATIRLQRDQYDGWCVRDFSWIHTPH